MNSDYPLSLGGGDTSFSSFESIDDTDPSLDTPLLPLTPGRSSVNDIETAAKRMRGAPAGSLYKNVGEAVTRQLTGFSPKEIKKSFRESWAKDKNLGPVLGRLKMAGRCLGFAIGTLVNVASKIAALSVALIAATTSGMLQFIFTPIKSFKKPHTVMNNIIGFGTTSGVLAGSGISFLGMKLSQCVAGIKLEPQDEGSSTSTFDRAVEDSSGAGLIGMVIGAGIACLYPAMWQLPFRDSGENQPSIEEIEARMQEILAARKADSLSSD